MKCKTMVKNVLFCPQLKYMQLTVTEEEKKLKVLKFKKLESQNFYFEKKKKSLKLIYQQHSCGFHKPPWLLDHLDLKLQISLVPV